MSWRGAVKRAATTVAVAVAGCDTCGPSPAGVQGGCHCDFLDETSRTTANVQAEQQNR